MIKNVPNIVLLVLLVVLPNVMVALHHNLWNKKTPAVVMLGSSVLRLIHVTHQKLAPLTTIAAMEHVKSQGHVVRAFTPVALVPQLLHAVLGHVTKEAARPVDSQVLLARRVAIVVQANVFQVNEEVRVVILPVQGLAILVQKVQVAAAKLVMLQQHV